jgi:hypothetical protein
MNVVTVYELVPGLMRIEASAEAFGVLNSLPEVQYVEFNHYRRPSVLRSSQTLGENGPIVRPPIPAATPRPIEWKKNGGDTRNYGLYQNN